MARAGVVLKKLPAYGLVKSVACAAAVAVMTSSVGACMTPSEQRADQIRFLELQLKIAALKCRFENPRFAGLYNRFVKAHRPSIKASRWPVEAFLARQTRMDMDTYVTKTANQISLASLEVRGFCENSAAVAKLAATSNDPLGVMDLLSVPYRTRQSVCVGEGQQGDLADAAPSASGSIRP